MVMVEQRFSRESIADVAGEVRKELARLELSRTIKPGQLVAIAGGSRGIRGIDQIIRTVVDEMKTLGAKPFIVPAMGSHGGGTAGGQRGVLERYGITENTMGCEIRSSMEVETIGVTGNGDPVYMDRHAAGADHVVAVNRVKPHTKFIGDVESGLVKMCLIGLGKRVGARAIHRAIDRRSWMETAEEAMKIITRSNRVAFGLAIVQNAYEDIAAVAALRPADFLPGEKELLVRARSLMGRLPFSDIDLLIVDEMGKEISGTGMDTNITGRKEASPMKVVRVFVRDLTAATRGNAQGIGLADITTRRLVEKIDYTALYLNSRTAYRTDSCKIPMTMECDRDALAAAMEISGVERPQEYRAVWIRNTLDLGRIAVSEAYRERLRVHEHAEMRGGYFDIAFNGGGNLISPFA